MLVIEIHNFCQNQIWHNWLLSIIFWWLITTECLIQQCLIFLVSMLWLTSSFCFYCPMWTCLTFIFCSFFRDCTRVTLDVLCVSWFLEWQGSLLDTDNEQKAWKNVHNLYVKTKVVFVTAPKFRQVKYFWFMPVYWVNLRINRAPRYRS